MQQYKERLYSDTSLDQARLLFVSRTLKCLRASPGEILKQHYSPLGVEENNPPCSSLTALRMFSPGEHYLSMTEGCLSAALAARLNNLMFTINYVPLVFGA